MILYPTETLYALGVNALDSDELAKLFALKEREATKSVSWLVRDIEDIRQYAKLPEKAERLAHQFLPGQLTLVLQVQDSVPQEVTASDRTVGFRISSDPVAQKVVTDFMEIHNAPLTCTSANVSGAPTLSTPEEILQQFGKNASLISEISNDGPRKGLASTVVRVIDEEVTVLREGEISEEDIRKALR